MLKRTIPLRISFAAALLFAGLQLFAQSAPAGIAAEADPSGFIGMKLEEMFARFGAPQMVYTARGEESWQDDVVFVYGAGDFYVCRDRVWQIGLKSVYGIKTGDAKAVALLVLGETTKDEGSYLLYNIAGQGWPLALRVNLEAGRVSAMYVYRPDY